MVVILCSFILDELFGKSVKNTFICKIITASIECLIILFQEKNQKSK